MVLAELGGKLRESLRKLHGNDISDNTVNELLSEIARALIEADVNVALVAKLRDSILAKVQPHLESRNIQKLVQRAVVDELTNLLTSQKKPHAIQRNKANVILFVGLQGAGKTTTVAKFANFYSKRNYKVAMVCADTFRAGALDQLKQNATKLRIPFYGSYSVGDPVQIARDGVAQFRKTKYEVILVDTSGRHKQQNALFEEMQEVAVAVQPNETVLVVDGTQGQAVFDQSAAFTQATAVGSVIVTKLDGHAAGGGALSAVAATNAPVIFTGSGEHFDDLEVFQADRFVSKLLGFGDLKGLMEAMKGDDHDKTVERMSKGEFTLRDMYNQFEKILNMGPLNKLAGMIPGMPDYLVPKGGDEEATKRLRKFMVMMDSMNKNELDGKVPLNDKSDEAESRIRRIARGSGCHPNQVKLLLQAHKQFEGMVSKMGKLKTTKSQQQQMAALRKNPNLLSQRLNQMDPRMLQQMGGRENVMAMMQQMKGGGGGMPDMSSMAGGFPGMGGGMPGGMDLEAMMKMAQSMGMPPPPGRR